MTLDYIRLPVSILQVEDLSFAQKIILALVASLSKGLKLSNTEIGKLLNISSSQVSAAINDMERKGYVRSENRQSRHRTMYFTENPKVQALLLHGKPESKKALLNGLTGTTSRKTRNITERTRRKDILAHGKKRKPKKTCKFSPPTVAQVKAYAENRGYPDFNAERFVEYYAVNDWHDSKGNPVRNWKQKLLAVWLKGEDGPTNVAEALGCGPCDEEDARRTLQEAGLWKGEQ